MGWARVRRAPDHNFFLACRGNGRRNVDLGFAVVEVDQEEKCGTRGFRGINLKNTPLKRMDPLVGAALCSIRRDYILISESLSSIIFAFLLLGSAKHFFSRRQMLDRRYSGSIDGQTMTLMVKLTGANEDIGLHFP